jgi:predicted transposase YbfD/YdcC
VRTLIWERRRDLKKTKPKWENRYFVASASKQERTEKEFYRTIRDHWGVESRNHWRKDAILYEDKTRCRTPWVISNLMLLRNLVIHAYEHTHQKGDPMPAWVHKNQRDNRTLCRRMMRVQWSK